MNIDERLQALTESLELLASLHKDNEKRFMRLGQRNLQLEKLVADIADGTARLLTVAQAHERRLDRHEERLDQLEG